ncbi:hypothetical protein L7F22_060356 [Adiantum nelumboides]|nr:hypothetical protein [Adiantum nelumboides]
MEQARPAIGLYSSTFALGSAREADLRCMHRYSTAEPILHGKTLGIITLKGDSKIKHRVRATATFDYNNAAAPIDASTPAFPSFLPPQVQHLRDSAARAIASRIRRLPVQTSLTENPIMTSCVKPRVLDQDLPPVLLLHGFDSSCLEWKNTYPRLERANIECWAFDILGWGFSYSEDLSSVGVAAKREHLYEFWRSYINRPMVLVGASLGGAVAIDFTLAHPEAVSKLVLVNAQGYAKGTGRKANFPKFMAYAGVFLLKNLLLRTYASLLIHHNICWATLLDQTNVGRLHCLMPGWDKASVDFMLSGGYNVASRISKIRKDTLVIWGEEDRIISKDVPMRFKEDLPHSRLVFISNSGHLPHVEDPEAVATLISDFCRS